MALHQVGLVSRGYSFFLTSLDTDVVNLDAFSHSGTNFTAFRLVDTARPEISDIVLDLVKSIVDEQHTKGVVDRPVLSGGLDTRSALIYDSVTAFALALDQLDRVQRVLQKSLDCYGEDAWSHGSSLINYMKMVEFVGLTGRVQLDASGRRTDFHLDLVELKSEGLNKVGVWSSVHGLTMDQPEMGLEAATMPSDAMANKSFVVTTILTPPYTMLVENTSKLLGNDRYEGYSNLILFFHSPLTLPILIPLTGFAIDLAMELSRLLRCNFTIKVIIKVLCKVMINFMLSQTFEISQTDL